MHIYLVLMYSLVIANLEGQLGLPNSQRLRRTALQFCSCSEHALALNSGLWLLSVDQHRARVISFSINGPACD